MFVRRIGEWWPLSTISAGRERVRGLVMDPRLGGRVYETWDDGTIVDWGEITTWQPPQSFVMSWRNTPAVTEVEIRFLALGPGLTRVELEHRGWEALTEEQLDEDCALPGGYTSGAYSRGWKSILEELAAVAGAPPP